LVFLLNGCSSSRTVAPTKLNDLIKSHQKVRVTNVDGQWWWVTNLQVKPDSTRWLIGSKIETVPTSNIKEVTLVRRDKAAIQGLGIGLCIGVPSFLILYGRAIECAGSLGFECDESTAEIAAVALFGGVLGGPLIGAVVGSKNTYKFYGPNIDNWKNEILMQIQVDHKLRNIWKEYQKRSTLSEDEYQWVKSLSQKEFEDYNNSGLNLKNWLINKLKE